MAKKKSDQFLESAKTGSIESSEISLDQLILNNKPMSGFDLSSTVGKTLESFNSHHLGINSAAKAALAQTSSIAGVLEYFNAQHLGIDSAARTALSQTSSIPSAIESFNAQHLGINSAARTALSQTSSIPSAIESFNAQHLGINSAARAALAQTSSIASVLESFNAQQIGINSAAKAALAQTSSIASVIESFNAQQIGINSAAKAALVQASSLQSVIESFNSQQIGINSALASIANLPAMENMLASFASSSARIMSDHNALSTIFASIDRAYFSSFDFENIENELTTAANQFNKAENASTLATIFTALPPLFQAIFFYFLLQVFQPILTSISANLLTPVVESYLQDNNLADREKVKQIKEIPLYMNDVNTKGLRFITGNNVRLRSKPSTKSEILDELVLGQIVTILSKDRNWIEVTYTYGDGEVMAGWVFTRYTAKFVR